jgi:hypothetical protein
MKEKVLNIISDPDIGDLDYVELLAKINRAAQLAYFKKFEKIIGTFDAEKIVVTTPGSDGRAEKASVKASPAEFIVFYNALSQSPEELEDGIRALCNDLNRVVESKDLNNTNDLLFSFKQLRPERVIDAYTPDLDPLTRKKILRSFLSSLHEIQWKKLKKTLQPRYKEADKIIESGVNRIRKITRAHYDLNSENVVVYYNQDNFQLSFKPGPLRSIQYRLAFLMTRLCRAEREDIEFLLAYPYNTIDRLDFMFDYGALKSNRDVLNDVKALYAFFLRMYHNSEMAWEMNHNLNAISYDIQKSKEIKDALKDLLDAAKSLFGI